MLALNDYSQVQLILRPTVNRPVCVGVGLLLGPDFNFLCLTITFFLLHLGCLSEDRTSL
jgi:hypothetical protein